MPGVPTQDLSLRGGPLLTLSKKVLRSVARGITPITQVMASPPTLSIGAANTPSTINSQTSSFGQGTYQPNDTAVFDHVAGKWVANGSTSYTGQGMTGNVTTHTKKSTPGNGIRFLLNGSAFDFCVNNTGHQHIVYVTDPTTGVRERASANDAVGSANNNAYHKYTFGGSVQRIIEIRANAGATALGLRGVNANGVISKPVADPDELKVLIIGDSHANHQGSDNTNSIALCWPDFLGERLGTSNVWCSANGGTGYLNAASPNGTYRQRIGEGDIDVANCGDMDVVVLAGTTNDDITLNGAFTDAALAAEMQLCIAAAMTAQPNALIIVTGPQNSASITTPSSRYDAMEAAVEMINDRRVIWLRGGWITPALVSTYIGSDGTHCNDAGMSFWGRSAAQDLLAKLRNV